MNNIHLFFNHQWSPVHLMAFAAVLLTAFFYYWKGTAHCPSRTTRLVLNGIRLMTVCVIIFIFLQPSLVFRKLEKEKNRIAILLDTSMSMEIENNDGKRKIDRAKEIIINEDGLIKRLRQDFEVDFYTFSDTLQEGNITDEIMTAGDHTDILHTVQEVIKKYEKDENLDGIVIVSDGTDNVLFDEDLLTLPYDSIKNTVKANIRHIKTPIAAVWTGVDKGFKDIFAADVYANEFGFVKNPFTVNAKIIVKGYTGAVIPVVLKEGNRIISTNKIQIVEGKEVYTVKFSFTPEKVGDHLYTVSASLLTEEGIKNNNSKSITVNIMRDRIRVMLVVGSPSWDGKFLRRFLKGQPSIDLITFMILRTKKNMFTIPVRDLSLIPFPTNELFRKDKELNKFDIVIFANFYYQDFIPMQYLKYIEEFVTTHGGGFMMIGGRRSFRGGGYRGTPMENILPVELKYDLQGSNEPPFIEMPFKIKLTKAGRYHPIFNVKGGGSEKRSLWENMPAFKGFNTSLKLKKEAVALAEHPSKGNAHGKYPIIAVMEKGKGRAMMIASDSLWRWNFLSAAQGGDAAYFNSFFSNSMKWLSHDPEFKRITIDLAEPAKGKGKKISFDVRTLDGLFRPSWKLNVTGKLTTPENKIKKISLKRGNDKGRYNASFIPEKNGTYKFEVTTSGGRAKKENAYAFVSVGESTGESEYLSLNGNLLKALADVSKGRFFNSNNLSSGDISFHAKEKYKMIDEKVLSLWDNVYLLSALITLLILEWFLRRRAGLN